MSEEKEITISKPQEAICSALQQRMLFLAGVGSGKSHCIGLISADFVINYPKQRGFIGANTYGQLSKSTLDKIFKVWEEVFGWVRGVHYVVDKIPPLSFEMQGPQLKDYSNTISFNNGTLIFVASLDNYKVIDGTEFTWACLDETKDTKEEAVKEVIIERLRQPGMWVGSDGKVYDNSGEVNGVSKKSWNPLYIFTSPAKVQWLNEWFNLAEYIDEITSLIFSKTTFFYKEFTNKAVCISSTYHNVDNLSTEFIPNLLIDLDGNQNTIDRVIYAFPFAKTGGEYISRFDRVKHVKNGMPYDPTIPVHLSFDFNVIPYMTLTVWQIGENEERPVLRQISEYCLGSPQNNTEDCCIEFLYDFAAHVGGAYFYGDPSGKARNTVSKDIKHNYQVVETVLASILHDTSDRVLRNHPGLLKSQGFVNKLFTGSMGIDLEINENCVNTINDLMYMKEGTNGGYVKETAKDENKRTYEKYGHCYDSLKYFVCSVYFDLYESHSLYN